MRGHRDEQAVRCHTVLFSAHRKPAHFSEETSVSIIGEIGRTFSEIAEASGNSWDAMNEQELTAMAEGLVIASHQCKGFLIARCGDSEERARVEVSRAMDLPPKVLYRRANECREIIQRGGMPNIPQHAAWIGIMLREIHTISARLDQKRAGRALN